MNMKKSSFKKPISLRSKFTRGFVHALNRINKRRSPASQSLSSREIYKNYCKVKLAADASIATAVGPKRAWSRAMLFKIRSQQRRKLYPKRVRKVAVSCPKKRTKLGKAKKMIGQDDHKVGFGQTKELRKLVPGGKEMDLCMLLTETAHYVQCLNTQVQVMRSLADFYTG